MRWVLIAVVLILAVVILTPIAMALARFMMRQFTKLSAELMEDVAPVTETLPEDEGYDHSSNYVVPEVVTLKQDVVIGTGTNMLRAPTKTERFTPSFEFVIPFGDNHVGYFTIDLAAIQEHPELFQLDKPFDESFDESGE